MSQIPSPAPNCVDRMDEIQAPSNDTKNNKGRFPKKLMDILQSGHFEEIISWHPDGKHWKVHKQKQFEFEVMSRYFDATKWASFVRQLNGWGFHKVTAELSNNLRGNFFHPLFQRDQPELCLTMKRQRAKSNFSKSIKKKEEEQETPVEVGLNQEPIKPVSVSKMDYISLPPDINSSSNTQPQQKFYCHQLRSVPPSNGDHNQKPNVSKRCFSLGSSTFDTPRYLSDEPSLRLSINDEKVLRSSTQICNLTPISDSVLNDIWKEERSNSNSYFDESFGCNMFSFR